MNQESADDKERNPIDDEGLEILKEESQLAQSDRQDLFKEVLNQPAEKLRQKLYDHEGLNFAAQRDTYDLSKHIKSRLKPVITAISWASCLVLIIIMVYWLLWRLGYPVMPDPSGNFFESLLHSIFMGIVGLLSTSFIRSFKSH